MSSGKEAVRQGPGLVEHFRPGEHQRVESVLEDLQRLGVRQLRTFVSWADDETPEGAAWYTWLLTRCAREVEVIPVFGDLPAALAIEGRINAPPKSPDSFADFLDRFIVRLGRQFEWLELWENPKDLRRYDTRLDPDLSRLGTMLALAAAVARRHGRKVVLPGVTPFDPAFTAALLRQVGPVDAVSIRGFPASFDVPWPGWTGILRQTHALLGAATRKPELWIHTGHAVIDHDERAQLGAFLDALEAPADRLFWSHVRDRAASDALPPEEGVDPREHRMGLRRADGSPRLLLRLWLEHGLAHLPELRRLTERRTPRLRGVEKHAVVFGGAGFIGSNVANALLEEGRRVLVFDNLGRQNVERNLRWLRERHGERLGVLIGDVRDHRLVRQAVENASHVYHFAAQVAVTTSLVDPFHDFQVNARGTLNVLEAARAQAEPPAILFTSTNKVYGGLDDIPLQRTGDRYEPQAEALRTFGVSERRAVDFESPYGCSKGAADQYVLDYARTFGLDTVVFRMSCIYGPRQFGNEDQGWVAHFIIRALEGGPITLYGDGRQVRDVLYVDDLVRAMRLAMDRMDVVSGRAFNIGGGPERTVSLLELLAHIEALGGRRPEVRFENWRTGDQRYYVSDIRAFETATGWRPRVTVAEGVRRLHDWLETTLFGGRRVRVPREAAEAANAI